MTLRLHARFVRVLAAVATVTALLLATFAPAAIVGAQAVDPGQPTVSVPPAECGPGSRPETGMQGQVPAEDRASGRSAEGYQCNLELVGSHQHGEGASWQFAWYDDCAYYGTLDTPTRSTANGAVVVDMSDPANPVGTALLDTPAMNDPHESLKVNAQRALLAANDLNDPGFDIYDIAEDCTDPQLLASVEFPGTAGHEGNFTPDGLTYYTGDRTNGNNRYCPIDVSDPRNPELIMCWPNPGTTHGMSFNDDGTRGYFSLAQGGNVEAGGSLNGLLIADTSEIQQRKPDPTIHVISTLLWSDGAQAQMSQPMTINGRPYLLFVDELGRGAGRIIDISDETNPQIVSRLKLDVHLAQNAGLDMQDGGAPLFVYDGHYCTVDDEKNSTAVACGYFESGIRVFDVREPAAPREIAYFNPPPITDRPLPASSHTGDHTVDRCAAQIRFVPQTSQLWTQCQDNELLTLRFTNGVYPLSVPARDIAPACPPDDVPAAGFRDVDAESAHAEAIDCVTWWGVARGESPSRFAPAAGVTRGQMASFVVGLIESSGTRLQPGRDRFSDDDGHVHEQSIDKLAAAGVVSGRSGRRFSPDALVTRAEMASVLAGGYELAAGAELSAATDYFDDDNSSVHEASINKLAAARLVSGTSPRAFSPGAAVSRAQLASFLARGLAQLVDDGKAELP